MAKCHICGKPADGALSDKRCRICDRYVCGKHVKDGVCNICREKMK